MSPGLNGSVFRFVGSVSARLGGTSSRSSFVANEDKFVQKPTREKPYSFKNGTHFGHLCIWDQFWAASARVKAIRMLWRSLPKMAIRVSKGEPA